MSDCNGKEFDSDDSNIYEVEFVYGKKMFKKKTLYAVKWLGWTISQMSWEPFSNFTPISSYLVRRLETKLCYAQYYKKIAPNSGGIRVHIKGKFCQVQQIDTTIQQKTIECEKKIVSHSSDTQDIYDKAQKIITQMKQNLLCSYNRKQHLKGQKKVIKQNNHFKKIINSQEKNQTTSSVTVQGQGKQIQKQINKKQKLNNKEIIDQELERDIQFLIKYEKQTKKLKQANDQQIQNKNNKDDKQQQQQQQQQQQKKQQQQQLLLLDEEKVKQQKYNNQQLFCEFQIILNEPDNSELIIPFQKQITPNKNTDKQIKHKKNINKQQSNVQDTHSYIQEESFEIDLLLVEDSEQQIKQNEQLKDIQKSSDIYQKNVKLLPYTHQNNQLKNAKVVKSVINPKQILNIPQQNSEIHYKTEKQFINEIIEEQKIKESEFHQGLSLKELLQLEIKPKTNLKTSQQIQQEIQKLQLESIILNKTTNRCSMPIIPKLKDVEIQLFESNLMNIEMIQYDLNLNEIRFQKVIIELIESHHLLIGKLLFKCLYDNGMNYYIT
ncbi:unnamed protein product [Paramecium primaurelia]|uniref:Chromo domain-containing protein n=1 Tax=Paramecium primaurelia TaxID=5886 RepID=A0A8S1NRE2_PARPR|nr:unnamed protein product [Paramecium primaurelia]